MPGSNAEVGAASDLDQGVALAAGEGLGVPADEPHVGVLRQQPRPGRPGVRSRVNRRVGSQPTQRVERGSSDEGVRVQHRRGVAVGHAGLILRDQRAH